MENLQPAYRMTLTEYQETVTPLIKEFNKFFRKNKQYLGKRYNSGYGSTPYVFVLFPEYLESVREYMVKSDYKSLGEDYFVSRWTEQGKTTATAPENIVKELAEFNANFTIINAKDELNENKKAVREALYMDLYYTEIINEEITFEKVQEILNSLGINMPKNLMELRPKALPTNTDYLKDLPQINHAKFSILLNEIRESFEPIEEQVYDKEIERYNVLITGYKNKKDFKAESLEKDIPFSGRIFSANDYYYIKEPAGTDRQGRPKTESVRYNKSLILLNNWERIVDVNVRGYVDSLKHKFIGAIANNFTKISQPIKSTSKGTIKVGGKGFEGSYTFFFENGSKFDFRAEAIYAGGYNIQCLHLRYLTHFEWAVLADGSRLTNPTSYAINTNFSTVDYVAKKEAEENKSVYEAVKEATTVKEIAENIYANFKMQGYRNLRINEGKEDHSITGKDYNDRKVSIYFQKSWSLSFAKKAVYERLESFKFIKRPEGFDPTEPEPTPDPTKKPEMDNASEVNAKKELSLGTMNEPNFSPDPIGNKIASDNLFKATVNTIFPDTISSMMNKLHPLDLWKQFPDGRLYRKFELFNSDPNVREILDQGIKESLSLDKGVVTAVISVIGISEADRVSKLYMEFFPIGKAQQPEWLFIGSYPTGTQYADRRIEKKGDYVKIAFVFDNPQIERVWDGSNYKETNNGRVKVQNDSKPEYKEVIEGLLKEFTVEPIGEVVSTGDEEVVSTGDAYADFLLNEIEKKFKVMFPKDVFERKALIEIFLKTVQERDLDRGQTNLQDILMAYIPDFHTEYYRNILLPMKNKLQRAPKFKAGDFVTYTNGDMYPERWYGQVMEVKDFETEYAYRVNAYSRGAWGDSGGVMNSSERVNEKYEVQLRKVNELEYNKVKAQYDAKHNPLKKIQVKEIQLQVSGEKFPYKYYNFELANSSFRRMLDSEMRSFSNMEYRVCFYDGEVLEGTIDCEPRSFFAGVEDPLSRHLKTWWTSISNSPVVYPIVQEDKDYANKLLTGYDLGEEIKKTEFPANVVPVFWHLTKDEFCRYAESNTVNTVVDGRDLSFEDYYKFVVVQPLLHSPATRNVFLLAIETSQITYAKAVEIIKSANAWDMDNKFVKEIIEYSLSAAKGKLRKLKLLLWHNPENLIKEQQEKSGYPDKVGMGFSNFLNNIDVVEYNEPYVPYKLYSLRYNDNLIIKGIGVTKKQALLDINVVYFLVKQMRLSEVPTATNDFKNKVLSIVGSPVHTYDYYLKNIKPDFVFESEKISIEPEVAPVPEVVAAPEKLKNWMDFIHYSEYKNTKDSIKSMNEVELKELLENKTKKRDFSMTSSADKLRLRDEVWELEMLVKAHEKARLHNHPLLKLNIRNFVFRLISDTKAGIQYNKPKLEKIAREFGITEQNIAKELAELAICTMAREIADLNDISEKQKYDKIVALYESQVNLSHRTSESILMQQYSTPAPIGYLAGLFCQKEPDGSEYKPSYFEPSAGNGLLTIAFSPKFFTVNEIDKVRLVNLSSQGFKSVISQDATNPFDGFAKTFDAVITNPPFGSCDPVKYGNIEIKSLEQLMALRALDTMKDDGKCAIIIGGHQKFDEAGRIQAGKNRIFFVYLYANYHVMDVINIDGHALYSRQGTAFDTRLILIDGRKSVPSGFPPIIEKPIPVNEQNSYTPVKDFETLWTRVNNLF